MSGKGKRIRETKFAKSQIDAGCLAYEYFRYSASKFGVHETCLPEWDISKNDYGEPSDHFRYICRAFIVNQLKFRNMWFHLIERYAKNSELESYESVRQILESLIDYLKTNTIPSEIQFLEASLALACELILYVHAKEKDLYLKELAEFWFEYYFRRAKKRFEREGGFEAVCWRGYDNVCDFPEIFIDLCIATYKYNDYKESSRNGFLFTKLYETTTNHKRKNMKYSCPIPSFRLKSKVDKLFFCNNLLLESEKTPNPDPGVPVTQGIYDSCMAGVAGQRPEAVVQEPPKQVEETSNREKKKKSTPRPNVKNTFKSLKKKDEDSEDEILQNPGLGVPTPKEMYDFPLGGDAPPSQNLPEESVQNPPKSSKRLSYLERKRAEKTSLRPREEQCHGQLSSDSSTTRDSGRSYKRQGAKPKVPVQNTGRRSSQTDESRLFSSLEQVIGPMSFDSSTTRDIGRSYEHHGPKPNAPVQNTGSFGLKTDESSLFSLLEQGIEQLNLGTSSTKLHGGENTIPSIANYLTHSVLDEIAQERTEKERASSSEEET